MPLNLLLSLLLLDTSPPIRAEALGAHPVVVGISGRDSCSGMSPSATLFNRRVKKATVVVAKPGFKTKTLWICFDRYDFGNGGIRFATSRAPGLIYTGRLVHVERELRELAKDSSSLYLVGYSYGGWLAMRLVERVLSEGADARLFTVDPISAKTCGPSGVISGAQGCKQAPTDLNHAAIQARTAQWENYFQTHSGFIHSGPMNPAHNFRFETGHTEIQHLRWIWNRIEAQVSANLLYGLQERVAN